MRNPKHILSFVLLLTLFAGSETRLEARQGYEQRKPQQAETAQVPDLGKGAKGWIETQFVRPTQTDIGRENVKTTSADMLKDAKGPAGLIAYFHKRFDDKTLPVVRGPDGVYYLTDGHHRTTSIEELYRDYLPGQHAIINVDVIEDFKGQSMDAFVEFMSTNNKVYFSKKIREEAREKNGGTEASPRFLMENFLMKDFTLFKDLYDSPMRSAVGNVMHAYEDAAAAHNKGLPKEKQLVFKSERLVEYFEFHVGDILAAPPYNIQVPENYGMYEGKSETEKKEILAEKNKIDRQVEDALYTMPDTLKGMWRRIVSAKGDEKIKLEDRNLKEVAGMVDFMRTVYERRPPARQPAAVMPAAEIPASELPKFLPGVPAPLEIAPAN